MYVVGIAATLMAFGCLETMHIITRRYGEKSLEITVSPVTPEKLKNLMDTLKKSGMDVHSFSVTDSVAVIRVHIRQKDYERAITSLMEAAKGLTVDIS
jgi:hypothetical protein